MGLLVFDPVLLTGVEEIDEQHRELFRRIAQLLEASRSRSSRAEVVRLLEFLDGYVIEHFAAEERLMQLSHYPNVDGHREEHRRFVKELEALRKELDAEGPTPLFVIRVGNRVTEWLREHIYRTDRMVGQWIRDRRS